MKKLITIQISALAWSALFVCGAELFLRSSPSKNIELSSLTIQDSAHRGRIYLGVPEGERNPKILMFDEKGENSLLSAVAENGGVSLRISSKAGKQFIDVFCNEERSQIRIGNSEDQASALLTMTEGRPYLAMCNQQGKPQIGATINQSVAKLIFGDMSGNAQVAMTSQDSGANIILQDSLGDAKMLFKYDVLNEVIQLQDSTGNEIGRFDVNLVNSILGKLSKLEP